MSARTSETDKSEQAASETAATRLRYVWCLRGIGRREWLRFFRQRARFIAALVRPLLWLVIFANGLRAIIETPAAPPYGAAVDYDVYIMPGLIAMILLFNGMQSSLSLVYDREMGSIRVLLVSPFPKWFLLLSKLLAGVLVSLLQVYAFLGIAWAFGIHLPAVGYLTVVPALVLCGLMLGALGLLLSSLIRELENFAGIMNFVIFPMFFASSALYPLSVMAANSPILAAICALNPFTSCVELVRFALYGQLDLQALLIVAGATLVFFVAAIFAHDPTRNLFARRGAGAS